MSSSVLDQPISRHRELSEIRGSMLRADLRKAETDDRRVIGRAIVRARSLLGWSLKELAEKVGKDARQVARWESGDERDRAQLDALWAVEEFRGPFVIALAEAVDDSGVVVTTHIQVRQKTRRTA